MSELETEWLGGDAVHPSNAEINKIKNGIFEEYKSIEYDTSEKFLLEMVDSLRYEFSNLDEDRNSQIDYKEVESALNNPSYPDIRRYLSKLADKKTIDMISGLEIDYSGPWYKGYVDSGIGKKDLGRLEILAGQMPEKLRLVDDVLKVTALVGDKSKGYNSNYEPIYKNLSVGKLSPFQQVLVREVVKSVHAETGIPESEIRPQDLRNLAARLTKLYAPINNLSNRSDSPSRVVTPPKAMHDMQTEIPLP